MGLAPEQQAGFPPDVALAYASALKAPPGTANRSALDGMGIEFRRQQHHQRQRGRRLERCHRCASTALPAASIIGFHRTRSQGFALAGSGTNWGLAQGLGGGRSDAFQVWHLRQELFWSGLRVGGDFLYQQLVHHQPHGARRATHCKIQW